MSYELGIVGAGNMAEAIARGVLSAKLFSPDQIVAFDISPQRRELFQQQLRIHVVEDSIQAVRDARMILLSVKPQQMATALAAMTEAVRPDALIISIAAGISCGFIENALGATLSRRVVRAMPNTPMLVGEGMVAIAPGRHATPQDLAAARRLFEVAAAVIEVSEDKIDAVTAVSGSGPAYFFYLVEHMIHAATELGLPPEQARTLVAKTAVGSAKMLMTSADLPEELRRKVTSPGGTTQAAIETMESRLVGQPMVAAVHRAAQRSKELGK